MASRSLALLCQDSEIPERQRQVFCLKVLELLGNGQTEVEVACTSLRLLWERYDSGGISVGRSLRAELLVESVSLLAKNQNRGKERVRFLLSVLLGMYHDHRYINAMGWYDYELVHFYESDLMHRVWLATAAFCLEIDDVADMAEWPVERLRALLHGS